MSAPLRWEKASSPKVWRAQPDDATLCLITAGTDGSRAPRPVYTASVRHFSAETARRAAALDFDLAELLPLVEVAEPFPTLGEAKTWAAREVAP